jgi:hypothetical protein
MVHHLDKVFLAQQAHVGLEAFLLAALSLRHL